MGLFANRTWRDDVHDDISHRLSGLRRELAVLSSGAGRYGHELQDGAGELGTALAHSGAAVARKAARQATRAGKAVKNDPAPTLVALVGIACLASLVLGRRQSR